MKNYCLISHTHWDREWYLPFENFRMRLVDLIDNLLVILDRDPEYRFHLDAQTIVLEDYLAIRPEKREILAAHIKSGRILVGPWYVQNDFHLTSGEATVRNLIIGTKIAKSFGASMPIGYAADQFGLISQLPQILKRFGLDDCVFGRGFDRFVTEFYWDSEDGSRVLCEHMKFWYNNAQRLSPDVNGALSLLRGRGAACAERCAGSNYLLMNGVDHLEAQEDLTEIIEKVTPLLDEDERVFQDTLPEFMARVRKEIAANGTRLKSFSGEFRDNGADNVLTGTLSSRVYLKKANVRAQTALEKRLEPLYSLLSFAGIKDYPYDYFTYLWKLLIENHPHDSICGCSRDAVHRHMCDRFERLEENTSELLERGIDLLSSHIAVGEIDDYRVILLNGTQLSDCESVAAEVKIPCGEDKGGFELFDEKGAGVPFIVEEIKRNVGLRILSPINLPGEMRVNIYKIRLFAGETAGLSYRALTLKLTDKPVAAEKIAEANPNIMENDFLRVEIGENGSVTLTHKASGAVYRNALTIIDEADRGESYVFVPGDDAATVSSAKIKAAVSIVTENDMISRREISYTLDCDRPEGKGSVGVDMLLSLDRRSDRLDVSVTLDNRLIRHRVRVLLPTGINTDTNYAGQPFDCVIRKKISDFRNDADHPNTDYFGVEDGSRGIAILQEGLYEYEHKDGEDGALALTLLRSTGRITGSYADEPEMTDTWRSPEGYCIGLHTARFAVLPYSGDHIKAKISARSQKHLSPLYAAVRACDRNKFVGGRPFVQGAGMPDIFYRPLENADKALSASLRFFTLESAPADVMIVSAIKAAEDGNGLVLRLFNSSSERVSFKAGIAAFAFEVYTADLAENIIEKIDVNDGKAALTAAPKEIVTLRFI